MNTDKLPKTRKKFVKILAIVLSISIAAYLLIGVVFERIVINISDSHQGTFFWKTDKEPGYGDFVYFDLEHELFPEKVKSLSKQLVCTAGDSLSITNNKIVCNNKTYALERMKFTSTGKPIPQFYFDGVVPSDKAVVYGTHQESFDSRYWGFVSYDQLGVMRLIY